MRSLVGCLERFELSASRATIWRANQLRYTHHIFLVRQKGLEPLTYCLEGSCSIQLSYWRICLMKFAVGAGDGSRTHVLSLEG